jgi:hypothetical protein
MSKGQRDIETRGRIEKKGKKGFKDKEDKVYTVKKAFRYSRPQRGCHLPNSPCAGIIYI